MNVCFLTNISTSCSYNRPKTEFIFEMRASQVSTFCWDLWVFGGSSVKDQIYGSWSLMITNFQFFSPFSLFLWDNVMQSLKPITCSTINDFLVFIFIHLPSSDVFLFHARRKKLLPENMAAWPAWISRRHPRL